VTLPRPGSATTRASHGSAFEGDPALVSLPGSSGVLITAFEHGPRTGSERFGRSAEGGGQLITVVSVGGVGRWGAEDVAGVGDPPAAAVGVDLVDEPVAQAAAPLVVGLRAEELLELGVVEFGRVAPRREVEVGELVAEAAGGTDLVEFGVELVAA
jgi:hypothetical protein